MMSFFPALFQKAQLKKNNIRLRKFKLEERIINKMGCSREIYIRAQSTNLQNLASGDIYNSRVAKIG